MSETVDTDAMLAEAVEHHRQGRLAEAERLYRAVLALDPRHPDANHNLGVIAMQVGRPDLAAPLFEAALAAAPDVAQFSLSLAAARLQAAPKEDSARQAFDQGIAHHEAGRLESAAECYAKALDARLDFAEAWNNLGAARKDLGELTLAEEAFGRALALRPDYPDAHSNLGDTLRDLGRLEEAEASYGRALALDPDRAEVHNNLGSTLLYLGKTRAAMDHLERAIALKPDYIDAHRNLLLTLLYLPDCDPDEVFAAHLRFAATLPGRPSHDWSGRDRRPDRRLRIGYLSSDFRSHPVAGNLLPVLRHHDPECVEIYCYAELVRADAVTAQFQSLAHCWRWTLGLDDRAVAEMIRADGIDILVVVAGRFDHNRPQVCAWRAAPVQISWYDGATSGLAEMDYLFSDRVLTPRGTRERFSERLACLPGLYVAEPPPPAQAVPRRDPGGPVVFASLNNPAKLTGTVLDLWGQLLRRVPDSRLLLKYFNWYGAEYQRSRVLAALAANGVEPQRIEFPGLNQRGMDHLDIYAGVDIALDPFPFSGSTTSFEALSMGVPVVTLAGETLMSRWTAAMLDQLDLGELIAESPGRYLDIAGTLAEDPARRAALRAGLPGRMAASSLCDGRLRARQIERWYRAVWRRWCGSQLPRA